MSPESDATPATCQAFAKAEQQRQVRAQVIQDVAEGKLSLAQVLQFSQADLLVAKIKLLPVVEATPGLTKIGSRRLLASLDVPEGCRLSEAVQLPRLPELIAQVEKAAHSAQATRSAEPAQAAPPAQTTQPSDQP